MVKQKRNTMNRTIQPPKQISVIKQPTIIFIRKAKKSIDGADGFLFLHSWGTGYQHVILSDMSHANRYLNTVHIK